MKYVSIFLFILLFSCKIDSNPIKLEKVGGHIINTGYEVPPQSFAVKSSITTEGELLGIMNRDQNSILIINNNQIIRNLVFAEDGPEGIGRLRGFSFVGDNLYLASSGKELCYISDLKGKISGTWEYDLSDKGYSSTYSPLVSRISNDVLFNQDFTCIAQQIYNTSEQLVNSSQVHPLMVCENHSNNTRYFAGSVPLELYKNGPVLDEISSCSSISGNDMVISISSSHNIFAINTATAEMKKYECPSLYFSSFRTTQGLGRSAHIKNTVYSNLYMSILRDSFRKVYYRFVRLSDEDCLDEDLEHYFRFPKNVVIQVIDEEYNLVDELAINGDMYNIENAVVMSNGLHISKNNPNREGYNENSYEFDIFSLSTQN